MEKNNTTYPKTISIKDFLDQQGIRYHEEGTELKTLCLFGSCDKGKDNPKNGHLYFNTEDSTFFCHKCSEKGNIYKLAKRLGIPRSEIIINLDKHNKNMINPTKEVKTVDTLMLKKKIQEAHQALLKNTGALKWIQDRGITVKTIKEFQLGYFNNSIAIPHLEDKEPISIKYRQIPTKGFTREFGTPSILFNTDRVDLKNSSCILVEGEMDAIIGHQNGLKNIIATTCGANTLKDEWLPFFDKFNKVYICLDSDEVGQEGAKKVAEKIGIDKCWNIKLPVKDLNDFFLKGHQMKELEDIFEKAEQFPGAKRILSLEDIYKMTPKKTPFILEGMIVENAINVISSSSGQGKSLFMLKAVESIVLGKPFLGKYKTKKTKTLILDLEMSEDEIVRRCQSVTEKAIPGLDIFFCQSFNIEEPRDYEWLVKKVKEKEYGLLVFDTLSAIHSKDENSNTEMNKINSILLKLTHELGITILLLHHNRKPYQREASNQASSRGASCIIDKASSQLIIEKGKLTNINSDEEEGDSLKLFIKQFKRRALGLLKRFGINVSSIKAKEKEKTMFTWAGLETEIKTVVQKAEGQIIDFVKDGKRYVMEEFLNNDIEAGPTNIRTAVKNMLKQNILIEDSMQPSDSFTVRGKTIRRNAKVYQLKQKAEDRDDLLKKIPGA